MMKNLKQFILFLPVVIVILISCSPLKNIEERPVFKPVPSSFQGITDTANAATISWKQYFTDPHLLSLIDTALLNNWDVKIALQRIDYALSDVLTARSVLKPSVNAGIVAGLRKFGLYTMDGAGNASTEIKPGKMVPENLPDYFIGLQTSWEIDLWGKLRNKKKAALSRFLATAEGRNIVITNLVAQVAINYYELITLDHTLKTINETIGLQENALSIVRVQKEAAAANELAVQQFESGLLHLRTMALEAMQLLAVTENEINFLLGRYPQTIPRDSSLFFNALPVQVRPGIPSALLQNRPDIREAEFELAASKADVLSAKAAFYPSLNINGNIGYQAFKAGMLFTTPESIAYSLLGSLAAPLINKAAIRAEFNKANAKQLEALYSYQKTIANGYREVYNEILQIKSLEQVYNLKVNETNILVKAVETSNELFKRGRATYLEVLLTQQNRLQSRLELINTKRNQFYSTINIYKALGGGWK